MKVKKWSDILKTTIYFSLIIQAITGGFNVGLLVLDSYDTSFDDEYEILIQLIWLSLIVQIIEGTFYIWLAWSINTGINITAYRYYDWFFSTPTMLITFVVYLLYLKDKKDETNKNNNIMTNVKTELLIPQSKKRTNNLWDYMKQNKYTLTIILLLNALMLLFGYLGEVGTLTYNKAVLFGFAPFIAYFYLIYEYFAKYTYIGRMLFLLFFTIWSLYGVAALAPYYLKNVSYNILDIFSKNFFELFICIRLLYVYNK
tara:strand:+ start:790 stop:1560 length:771 start_codon:yes stop_codon:yes gene_type:complete